MHERSYKQKTEQFISFRIDKATFAQILLVTLAGQEIKLFIRKFYRITAVLLLCVYPGARFDYFEQGS